ncbi:MAG: energy transducer TonB, partial [bacterium]
SFDEAALNALKGIDWQPAEYNGNPVKAWVAIPVLFKLGQQGRPEAPPAAPKVYAFSNQPASRIEYDEPPKPVGGFKAIQGNLKYPKIAYKAGIEGRVVAEILISEQGKVLDSNILESLGESGCDEAAVNALKSVHWQPAMKNGQGVKTWVRVPVVFKLR